MPHQLTDQGDEFLARPFIIPGLSVKPYPGSSTHLQLHFRKEIVKRLLPFGAWKGAAAQCRLVRAGRLGRSCSPTVQKGWSFESRGGQAGGVFLRSFLFLASPCARTVIPRVRSGDRGEEAGRLHPSHRLIARGWRLGKTSPEEPCPTGEVFRSQDSPAAGAAGAPHPGTPATSAPPTLAGSGFLWPRRCANTAAAPAELHGRCKAFLLGIEAGRGRGDGWVAQLGGAGSALAWPPPGCLRLAPTCLKRLVERAPSWEGRPE